jgi:hypothetical protein
MLFCRTKACFAQDCAARIPARILMCAPHWAMVPRALQIKVNDTLAVWQSGGSPKPYLEAIKRARYAVAAAQKRGSK